MWPQVHICSSLVFSHLLDQDPPGKPIFFCLQGQNTNAAFPYPATLWKTNCRLAYLHCKARWHHVFWPLELRHVNAYTRFKQQRGLAVWSVNEIKTHSLACEQPPLTTRQFALEWHQSTTHHPQKTPFPKLVKPMVLPAGWPRMDAYLWGLWITWPSKMLGKEWS